MEAIFYLVKAVYKKIAHLGGNKTTNIGKTAVELLIQKIMNSDIRGTKIQLPTKIVLYETCLNKTGLDIYE